MRDDFVSVYVVTTHNRNPDGDEIAKRYPHTKSAIEYLAQIPEDRTLVRVFGVDKQGNVTYFEPAFKGRLVLLEVGHVNALQISKGQRGSN